MDPYIRYLRGVEEVMLFLYICKTLKLMIMTTVIILIIVGILLMAVEFLLVPGVGIAGIFSFLCLGAACWLAFDVGGGALGWPVMAVVTLLLVITTILILRAKTWKRFELGTDVSSKVNEESSLVKPGDRGVAKTRLAPMGTGSFAAVTCEVKSHDNGLVAPGTAIEVVAVEDNQVYVKPIDVEKE